MRRFIDLKGAEARRVKADGDLIVPMAFSSEEPVERWWGVEILDHSESSIRLDRLRDGAPVLFNHDMRDLRGVHERDSIHVGKDRVLRGNIRITSKTAVGRDTIGLVETDVLTKASVGYRVHKVIEQTTKRNADGTVEKVEREISGDVFERLIEQLEERGGARPDRGAFYRALDTEVGKLERADDDEPIYRVMDWEPFENSLVTIPADNTVGIGRSVPNPAARTSHAEAPAVSATTTKGVHMDPKNPAAAASADDPSNASSPAQPKSGPSAAELEADRIAGIDNLCKANNIDHGIRNVWVTSGASMRSVSDQLLTILQKRADSTPKVTQLGLSGEETRRFSLSRAIDACSNQNWTQAGFEAECSRTIAQKLNRNPDPNRFFVPWEVQQRANVTPIEELAYRLMKRDLTVATAGAGGYLVETSNVGFIELLRNKSVLYNMGALRLSGLVGNVSIPKQSASGSPTWLANEASTISEINQTFVQVAMAPKNVGGYTEISRQLLLQSNPSAEGIVMADLASVVALDIDAKGLNGSGAGGQPTGILNTAGIGSVTGTSLDYADIIEFQTDVFAGNALNAAAGYVTTGAVAGLLKARVKFASTASPIWNGRLEAADVDGYRGMASNQMPSATMLFGDFGQVVIGEWGVLEVEVNPYANFQAGIVGVRAIASVDIAVRYPTAFSASSSIT